jgi:FMN phosphatase YigB (HAD superfamily)
MPATRTRSRKSRPAIKAIIFDIGRVIVRIDPRRILSMLGEAAPSAGVPGASPEKIWAAIQQDPLWIEWQEGRVSPQNWWRHLSRRFSPNLSYEDFCAAWNSVIIPEPDLLLPDSLFEQLAKRRKLVLLSNTDPLHVAYMEANFRFMRHFPARIYSCNVHHSKPDPAIFRAAIRAVGEPAPRILYVDDIKDYLPAARRLGLQAIQFKDRAQFESALRRRSLL